MKVKVEPPVQIVVTLTLCQTEADLLMRRAELAHEKFEGPCGDWHVMGELAKELKKQLKGES